MPSHETMSSMNSNSLHEMTIQDRPHLEYSPEEHQQRARVTSQQFDEKTEFNTQAFVAIPASASPILPQTDVSLEQYTNQPD